MVKSKNNRGQALLIMMLALAVVTTLTLSVVSRSISKVEVTSREEESLRAFSAAEAGIEQGLVSTSVGTNITQNLEVPTADNSTSVVGSYNADVVDYPENAQEFPYPFELFSGDTATVWLATYQNGQLLDCGSGPCFQGSTVNICWGTVGTLRNKAYTPAIIASVIYESGGGYHIAKAAFDPWPARRTDNSFTPAANGPDCFIGESSYEFSATMDLSALGVPVGQAKLMTIKMLYNDADAHFLGVSTGSDLPTQGKQITSTGSAGNSSRKIEAFVLNPTLPSIFEYSLYSGADLVK